MSIDPLLTEIVSRLEAIQGVEAVVLGGSRARGTQMPTSDIDVGIYYDPARPLDLEALNKIATELDDEHRAELLTTIGGWGPWINGGGWLTIQNIPVDFLYRDLARVTEIIAACRAGHIDVIYQPGHPHCFTSAIYMGEVAVCQSLWDPRDTLARLKAQTSPYSQALKRALVQRFGWEADFSCQIAHKSIKRGDITYAAGCCFRAVACVLQTLFALNETYWLNEKGALALVATFPLCPPDLQARVEAGFASLSAAPEAIAESIAVFEGIVRDAEKLSVSVLLGKSA